MWLLVLGPGGFLCFSLVMSLTAAAWYVYQWWKE
jgi:hypothetical protein